MRKGDEVHEEMLPSAGWDIGHGDVTAFVCPS